MLNFDHGEYKVRVKFKHIPPHKWEEYSNKHVSDWFEVETGARPDMAHGMTSCTVEILRDNGGDVCMGFSACSKGDQYNRKKGRKIALARALCCYDKPFRTLVWDKYLEVASV